MGRRDGGELVLDGRRDHAVAGPGHHQVAHRRRRRSRDGDHAGLRHRRRRRLAARRGAVARPHRARAGAVPAADHGRRSPSTSALAPRRSRRPASTIGLVQFFGERRRTADRRRRARLFLRRRPVRGADLRRRAELGGRGPPRARHRRGQYAERDLHGRRLAGDDPAAQAGRPQRIDGDGPARRSPISPRRSTSSAACRPTSSSSPCGRCGGSSSGSKSSASRRLPPAGTRSIVAVNHISLLDAPIILSLLDGRPLLVIDAALARRWWIRPFLKLCDARLLDPTQADGGARSWSPRSREGRRLVIFPEGRSTRHRLADQGLRRRGDDRRQGRRADHGGQDRRPRPLAASRACPRRMSAAAGFPRRR